MADLRKWKHTGGYEVGETLPTIEDGDTAKFSEYQKDSMPLFLVVVEVVDLL